MYTIDNKFEIGQECYSAVRQPIVSECPICKGKGKFIYNGYEIDCRQCSSTGKIAIPNQTVLVPCKVKVRRIKATIWSEKIQIKYVVDNVDNRFVSVKNRNQNNMFITLEEAEEYCKAVNTKQIVPEF